MQHTAEPALRTDKSAVFKGENMEKKLQVLSQIAKALNERGISWAVGASAMLYFNGIANAFHDLDIMIWEEQIESAREAMAMFGAPLEREENPQYRTRHFLEYIVEGVEVDIMAGFVIMKDGIAYSAEFDGSHVEKYVMVKGQRVPLQRLSDWERYYTLMGRPRKAEMCRQAK